MTGWIYEPTPPMGGATGGAYANTLSGTGMDLGAVLAREAIQNSVDAADTDDGDHVRIRVRFEARELRGVAKREFVAAASLFDIRSRLGVLKLPPSNCLATLEDDAVPIRNLFVEDFRTTGLVGDWRSDKSNFRRFLLSLGDDAKLENEKQTGGSYGYGKSVYSSNSSIALIFVYSRTRDAENQPLTLLMGCAYQHDHRLADRSFTGRAWFGIEEGTNHHDRTLPIVHPFLGAEAEAYARGLGMPPRDPDELGTSVMIVDTDVALEDIVRGVEDFWWPRIQEGLFEPVFVDEEGREHFAKPASRPDLRPFIEAYDIAVGRAPPIAKRSYFKEFNRVRGSSLGRLGLVVLPEPEHEEDDVPEDRQESVALIRSPLMVVAYHRKWHTGAPKLAGAFVAAPDVDNALRLSEPPAHDKWDEKARRLQAFERDKDVVKAVLGRIRRDVKDFQRQAAPPSSPRGNRLSLLERTLASFLAARPGPPPPPDGAAAPVSITYRRQDTAPSGDELVATAAFDVGLSPAAEVDRLRVRVEIDCFVLEDGGRRSDGRLPINVDVEGPAQLADGAYLCELSNGAPMRFVVTSVPYDASWTVEIVPEVTPAQPAT
jgi:hypothetical protein